jgi:hypothetical protein
MNVEELKSNLRLELINLCDFDSAAIAEFMQIALAESFNDELMLPQFNKMVRVLRQKGQDSYKIWESFSAIARHVLHLQGANPKFRSAYQALMVYILQKAQNEDP